MTLLLIRKVIDVTPQVIAATKDDDDYHTAYGSGAFLPDNASQACGLLNAQHQSSSSCSCPCSPPNVDDHHLIYWNKALRWVKLIAVKVGRSYYALPVALVVLTLLVGLVLGFLLGRRYEQQRRRLRTPPVQQNQRRLLNRNEKQKRSCTLYLWCAYCGRLLHTLQWMIHELLMWRGISKFATKLESSSQPDAGSCETTSTPSCRIEKRPFIGLGTSNASLNHVDVNNSNELELKEEIARVELKSDTETECESGLSDEELPRHVAVIMDGNRRYGERQHGNAMQGHWEGSRKLLQFAKWCLAERIPELTVYAFSTENWHRDATEVAALMGLIARHCEELRVEAVAQQICVRIQSTDASAIPFHVRAALARLEHDTAKNHGTALLHMNICLSYGSRGEIVEACRTLAEDYRTGRLTSCAQITERALTEKLLVSEPDLLIRTSGECRISNFLLWQLAYAELFFLDKNWPELEKKDLLQVLESYARGRQRRFGK